MSDNPTVDQVAGESNDFQMPSERELLMRQARTMGISFSNNISTEKLRERIRDVLNGEQTNATADPNAVSNADPLGGASPGSGAHDGAVARPAVKKMTLQKYLRDKHMRLVRLRITNLDPKKKDLPGEIITVANSYIGTVRKFVPFGEVTDEGYHVPYCIYRYLENRRFLNIRTIRDRRTGRIRVEQSWAKEFALEVLPPLTREELAKLAAAQAAAGSIETSQAI